MHTHLIRHPASLATDIPIDQGTITLYSPILDYGALNICEELIESLHWRQDNITIRGVLTPIPRLQAWYGEAHCFYAYSGLSLHPQALPPLLQNLSAIAESISGAKFNCVLCNLYRHGQDSVSWHADNEPELGRNPTIASYSFGAERRFLIKPKRGKQRAMPIPLRDNTLLIMAGSMQHHWLHQIPKTSRPTGPRVNLTFRYIPKPDKNTSW